MEPHVYTRDESGRRRGWVEVVCGSMFYVTRSDIPAIENALRSSTYDSVELCLAAR